MGLISPSTRPAEPFQHAMAARRICARAAGSMRAPSLEPPAPARSTASMAPAHASSPKRIRSSDSPPVRPHACAVDKGTCARWITTDPSPRRHRKPYLPPHRRWCSLCSVRPPAVETCGPPPPGVRPSTAGPSAIGHATPSSLGTPPLGAQHHIVGPSATSRAALPRH